MPFRDKEARAAYHKAWREKNHEESKEYQREYQTRRRQEDFVPPICKCGKPIQMRKGKLIWCSAQCLEYLKQRREKQKERTSKAAYKKKGREAKKEEYWAAPEKYRRLRREANVRNVESTRRLTKKWRKENPERYKLHTQQYDHRRRIRKQKAPGKHTLVQWLARVEYYGWCCRYCSEKLTPKTVSLDHVIPLSRGGTGWASNLVPACKLCNARKQATSWRIFLAKVRESPSRG